MDPETTTAPAEETALAEATAEVTPEAPAEAAPEAETPAEAQPEAPAAEPEAPAAEPEAPAAEPAAEEPVAATEGGEIRFTEHEGKHFWKRYAPTGELVFTSQPFATEEEAKADAEAAA